MPQARTNSNYFSHHPRQNEKHIVNYRRYISVFAIVVLPVIVFINLHLLFLWNIGELQSYDKIVRRQIDNNLMYLSSFATNYYSYKLALARLSKPEIVLIGTSRTMQFRSELFKTSFTNVAGVSNHWGGALEFMKELKVDHQPKIAIIGIEYNWFREDPWPKSTIKDDPATLSQPKLRQPFHWIADRKITIGQYLSLSLGLMTLSPIGRNGLGVQALILDRGFTPDGHYRYGLSATTAYNRETDTHFHRTLQSLQRGEKTFAFGSHVGMENWELFENFVGYAMENDISLVFYFPPLAYPLYEALQKTAKRRDFVNELQAKLRTVQGVEIYDFTNSRKLGASDCEFYNGTHPGDIQHDRMLLSILTHNPQSKLSPYLDKEKLGSNIQKFSGRAIAESGFAEDDFLALGCNKKTISDSESPGIISLR